MFYLTSARREKLLRLVLSHRAVVSYIKVPALLGFCRSVPSSGLQADRCWSGGQRSSQNYQTHPLISKHSSHYPVSEHPWETLMVLFQILLSICNSTQLSLITFYLSLLLKPHRKDKILLFVKVNLKVMRAHAAQLD